MEPLDPKAELMRLLAGLHYNADTGKFIWTVSRRGVRVGRCAGTQNDDGYVRISLGGKLYAAHRLAWLVVYGTWPADQIDHINGDRSDNRIANLRDVTQTENQRNRLSANRASKSGVLGVSPSPHKPGLWLVHLSVKGKNKRIGKYTTIESAKAAYQAAKEIM